LRCGFLPALPALLTPVLLVGGMLLGYFTPTEAASVTVAYVIVISGLVYRTLTWRHLLASAYETVKSSSAILIIVAVWKGFALVSRLASERRAALRRQAAAAGRAAQGARAQRAGTVELRPCPRCGAYVDPREDCSCGLRRNEARRAGS